MSGSDSGDPKLPAEDGSEDEEDTATTDEASVPTQSSGGEYLTSTDDEEYDESVTPTPDSVDGRDLSRQEGYLETAGEEDTEEDEEEEEAEQEPVISGVDVQDDDIKIIKGADDYVPSQIRIPRTPPSSPESGVGEMTDWDQMPFIQPELVMRLEGESPTTSEHMLKLHTVETGAFTTEIPPESDQTVPKVEQESAHDHATEAERHHCGCSTAKDSIRKEKREKQLGEVDSGTSIGGTNLDDGGKGLRRSSRFNVKTVRVEAEPVKPEGLLEVVEEEFVEMKEEEESKDSLEFLEKPAELEEGTKTSQVEISGERSASESSDDESLVVETQPQERRKDMFLTPLSLKWVYGFNPNVPLVNLTTRSRSEIAFAAGYVVVLYDYKKNSQRMLQGHKNVVSSMTSDASGRYLAIADKGRDHMLTIWDTRKAVPLLTIYDPHPGSGVEQTVFSYDGKFIMTLSSSEPQVLCLWDWTNGLSDPLCKVDILPEWGWQINLAFDPTNSTFMLSNSSHQVVFYTLRTDAHLDTGVVRYFLEIHAPVIGPKDFVGEVGSFTMSTYQRGTRQALSVTSIGNVVVWSDLSLTGSRSSAYEKPTSNKKLAVKMVRLDKKAITCLTETDGYIVTGNASGAIHFYDSKLKLMQWHQNFNVGSIRCIGFHKRAKRPPGFQLDASDSSASTDTDSSSNIDKQSLSNASVQRQESSYQKKKKPQTLTKSKSSKVDIMRSFVGITRKEKKQFPSDLSLQRNPFYVTDFIVGTMDATYCYIQFLEGSAKVIMTGSPQDVVAVDCHPLKSYLCLGSTTGQMLLYNYELKQIVARKQLSIGKQEARPASVPQSPGRKQPTKEPENIQCIAYSPVGSELAVGTEKGNVWILKAFDLASPMEQPFHLSRAAVVQCCFSHDNKYLATRDVDRCVCVFIFNGNDGTWSAIGKFRSHYRDCVDIMFGQFPETGKPRLLSLGQDRKLIQYDLENSTEGDLRISYADSVEQSALPLCMAWYPKFTSESFIVMANDQHKIKLYNALTRMTRKTTLGPLLGHPIHKMIVLPPVKELEKIRGYMLYVLHNKIGLQILPVDGNPFNTVAFQSHTDAIATVCLAHDGNHIFSCCGPEKSVFFWEINTKSVEASSRLGGRGILPFYSLIPGGRHGDFFHELLQYFHYSQILGQGKDQKSPFRINDTIPLQDIPHVLRAVGFYPTDYEVENIFNELQYCEYLETSRLVRNLDVEDFLRIYINHRPAFGLCVDDVKEKFELLCSQDKTVKKKGIDKYELLKLLQERGECMSKQKLIECLESLLTLGLGDTERGKGTPAPPTKSTNDPSNEIFLAEKIKKLSAVTLPNFITYKFFIEELLGFHFEKDDEDETSIDDTASGSSLTSDACASI